MEIKCVCIVTKQKYRLDRQYYRHLLDILVITEIKLNNELINMIKIN